MVELGTLIQQAKTVRCGSDDYPILSMTMHDGLVFQDDKFKKIIASKDRSDYKVVKRNQLVISFPIDEGVLAAQRIVDAGIVSPAYSIWDIDQEKILPEFLEYALRCDRALSYYKAKLRGSTARRRSLPTPTLLAFTVPLPGVSEQQFVLDVIHKAKKIIDNRSEEIQQLDNLVKARFVEMFGDPKTNPKNYPIHQLSEYIDYLTSGSRGWAQYCADDGPEWFITIKNVKDCRISVDNMQPVNAPDNAEAKRTKVQEGDLLISITADLGRTGVVTKAIAEHGAYINQHLTCIRLNKEFLNPLYVAYFMESPAGKEQFESKNQSAVKAGLNFNSINSLRLMVPPMDKQNAFVEFVKQIDKSKVVESIHRMNVLFNITLTGGNRYDSRTTEF